MAKDPADSLAKRIRESVGSEKVTRSTLRTSDRILARITDGIYRQPASALRELISNAYDADASEIRISTDPPRFGEIRIWDNGNGLTEDALASLICHIGGSPKRTQAGADLNVVAQDDPSRSPGGRKLIGKIGIGLFSVAQMTQHFQVITKTRGTDFRLVADIILRTYNEEELVDKSPTRGESFASGSVEIRSVSAADTDSHGTEVILMGIREQTRRLLRSWDRWQQSPTSQNNASKTGTVPPEYHISRLREPGGDVIEAEANLPWDGKTPAEERFPKLYDAILETVGSLNARPKLEVVLDYYLKMLWTLSLSAPIDYIDKHPFDSTAADKIPIFELGNKPGSQAAPLKLKKGERVRDRLSLSSPDRSGDDRFSVFVDGVKLFRPIKFTGLPTTTNKLKTPLLFVGKFSPDLSDIPEDIRGGNLSFEAYLFWAPTIVPTEHRGVLVRINDANGTLYDETFMNYQISEQTRLRQVTAEIFVREGLDAALNIDRESFNYAHPHYQVLALWVHNAFRQFATRQKSLAKTKREDQRDQEASQKSQAVAEACAEEVALACGDDADDVPEVVLLESGDTTISEKRKEGTIAFERSAILPTPETKGRRRGAKRSQKESLFEERIKAIAKILSAYDLLDGLAYDQQQELLRAIARIFNEGDQ